MPHNLINKKLINLIETNFHREGTCYLACDDKIASLLQKTKNGLNFGLAKRFVTLDNIFIQFGTKLHIQNAGILMGTNCAPRIADLFLFCHERDLMMSLILVMLKLMLLKL